MDPGNWKGVRKVQVSAAKIIGIETGAQDEEKAQESFHDQENNSQQ